MNVFILYALVALSLLLDVPTVSASTELGTLSPIVDPAECNPPLPTMDEAESRLRSLGIPEKSTFSPTASSDIEDLDSLPNIPAGAIVDDPTVRESLVSSFRRFTACQYLDVFMTFFAFSSDQELRTKVASVEVFEEAEASEHSGNPDRNRETHTVAVWEVFGIRQIAPNIYGFFTVEGRKPKAGGQDNWFNYSKFYIFSRDGSQYFLKDILDVGEVCRYSETLTDHGANGIPLDATPESSPICS
jgi:hypothetical protein